MPRALLSLARPSGFNWDVTSSDEPVQDDPRLTNYNVRARVDDFVAAATALSNATQGEHVMFTMVRTTLPALPTLLE